MSLCPRRVGASAYFAEQLAVHRRRLMRQGVVLTAAVIGLALALRWRFQPTHAMVEARLRTAVAHGAGIMRGLEARQAVTPSSDAARLAVAQAAVAAAAGASDTTTARRLPSGGWEFTAAHATVRCTATIHPRATAEDIACAH